MNIMDVSEEFLSLPSYVAANGWIPFVVAILLSMLFSYLYVKYFWSHNERDKCSAMVATFGFTIALLSASLLPVDVFLVSYMKNPDGSFKEWATNSTRETLENTLSYTYYSVYGIVLVYTFCILPLAYFSYEERDEDRPSNVFPAAFLYTLIMILVVAALLLAGAFIPFKTPPRNSTEWDKFQFLIKDLYQNRGQDALEFVINVFTIFGMLNLVFYTSVGLASFPLTLIKGFRPLSEEEVILADNQATTQSKINALRNKQTHKSLSSRETSTLADLEEEESLISKRSSLLESQKKSLLYKCESFCRIFNGICGCVGIAFSLLLFISLLIANIDKLLNSLGIKMGYVLKQNSFPNPMDYVMVNAQKVFPLDYVLFFSIVIFLVTCTISGMRYLGIWCLCIKMYKVRPGRTTPQGLLLMSFILMFTVLAFHILTYSVIPQYSTFGNQYYCNGTDTPCDLKHCTLDAPRDDCVMTRGAAFVLRFAYKAWIFSAVYYWLTWLFLAMFIIGFLYILIRSRRSSLEEAVDKDDFDDSDDYMIRA